MATLYKRANSIQQRMLRIIEGAVKNTADAHPEFRYSPKLGRSIAKRAVGTLSAQLAGVLAAPAVRQGEGPPVQPRPHPSLFQEEEESSF